MTEQTSAADAGWFADLDADDVEAAAASVREGAAESPADWPAHAVDAGFAMDEDDYYGALHEATVAATRRAVRERERASDRQVVHAVRAMDDLTASTNELAERLSEWAGAIDDDPGTGVEYARELASRDPESDAERRVVSLARRVRDLAAERDATREFLERQVPAVAPNLASMAGPVLAARLMELAGGLDALAKTSSSTVQVLGAEDALFAHLRGNAPSPKHGVIYTHEYVRGTHPDERGSAARALAGKLTIGARIDHYSGEYRPDVERELDERIETIRARHEGGEGA